MDERAKPLVYVSGAKGGTGKSLIAMGTIDYVQHRLKKRVALVETDTANPDVYKAYGEEVDLKFALDLDVRDGWIELLNICDQHPELWIVVNAGARNVAGVVDHGSSLMSSLSSIGREFRTLWVLGSDRDSVELLADYRDAMREGQTQIGTLHVVTNAGRGDEREFPIYRESETAKTVAESGGKQIHVPHLALRVADDLRNQRLSFARAQDNFPFGHRMELERWRREVHRALEELDNG